MRWPLLCAAPWLFSGSLPCVALATANAGSAPLRHLVYSFTYNVQGDLSVRTEIPMLDTTQSGPAGLHEYKGTLNDTGTITVDVVRQEADSGLVVTISEQGTQTQRAEPARCVTYGTTDVICDPNKRITSEEMTLLRFLGSGFVDPNRLDAKRHWRFEESNPTFETTADYTIGSLNSGLASIQETRVVKEVGARPATTDISTSIRYDMNRTVPTAIAENAIRRDSTSVAGLMTTTFETTLNLVSDSTAKP